MSWDDVSSSSSTGWWSPTWWTNTGANWTDNSYYGADSAEAPGGWKYVLRACHGGAMIMTWAIFTATGVVVARYGRHKHWWIHVHRRMQTAGFLLTLPLTFLSFATKNEGTHYSVIHSQLGLTVSILSFIQGLLGGLLFGAISFGPCIAIPIKVKKQIRLVARFLHHWNGRCVVSLALAVIFLGMIQLGIEEAYQITYIVYLCLGFIGLCYLEVNHRMRPHHTHSTPSAKPIDEDERPTHYEEELLRKKEIQLSERSGPATPKNGPATPRSQPSTPPASNRLISLSRDAP